MRDQNIKIIREAAVAANKSILDLKLGCEVVCQFEGRDTRGFVTDEQDSFGQIEIQIPGLYSINQKTNILEIIGRKVGLADVLLAIESQSLNVDLLTLANNLSIYEPLKFVKGIRKHCHWNLLKDSLEDQSDETLQFLSTLLAHREG